MAKWLSCLLLALIFPTSVQAHDFHQLESGLYFNATDQIYRLRLENKPWQLVDISGLNIFQSLSFDDSLFLVVEQSGQQLVLQQTQPLSFELTDLPPSDEVKLVVLTGQLLVEQTNGAEIRFFVWQNGGFKPIDGTAINSAQSFWRLVELNGELLRIEQLEQQTKISKLTGLVWQLGDELSCGATGVANGPVLAILCDDGRLLTATSWNSWQTASLPPVTNINHSTQVLVAQELADSSILHIWDHAWQSILLPLSAVNLVIVNTSRIIIQSSEGWHELLWQSQPPTLLQLTTDELASYVPAARGEAILLYSLAGSLVSEQSALWRPIQTMGAFNHALKTPTGYLIWQTDNNTGGLTQFAPIGSDSFTKVNPWSSTTSPIQNISLGDDLHWASVITQSGTGNVNLYRTTNFTEWSRVTLPTKATRRLPISQIRNLVAGSLVEFNGLITVLPGVVGSEIIYLQDQTGGIQAYLSKAGGTLPVKLNHLATVTGEVSSSQTKRVVLSDPGDLLLGLPSELPERTIIPDEAANYLGERVQLEATVGELSTDSAQLRQLTDFFKLHFKDAKTIFQANDRLSVQAVVDWNSSTDEVEAWATSGDYTLLSRANPSTSAAAKASTPAVSSTTKTQPKNSTVASTASQKAVVQSLPVSNRPVKIAGTNSTNNELSAIQLTVLIITTLLAGALAVQGRRFRQYLDN